MRLVVGSAVGLALVSVGMLFGADSAKAPRPVPLTRPEMKELLEDMKGRKPRIPLPELTEPPANVETVVKGALFKTPTLLYPPAVPV